MNNTILLALIFNVGPLACVISAAYVTRFGYSIWGWFLFAAVLMFSMTYSLVWKSLKEEAKARRPVPTDAPVDGAQQNV